MDGLSRREKEKQAREAEIIAAAEKLFYQKGFEGASMDEVAKAAQFTKRTVYQYFVNKENLYLAVALKGFKQLISFFETAIARGNTGIEKIHLFGSAYYQFLKNFPDTFRLLSHCRFIKREESPAFKEMKELDNKMYQMFIRAIEEGKTDGSIRADLDARKGACFMAFVSMGFLNLFSESGKNLKQHYNLDQEEFILFGLDLLYDAIKAR